MRYEFDIADFDPHPAFRLKRDRSSDRPVRTIPRRNANVWPLPAIGGVLPSIEQGRDTTSLFYAETDNARLPPFAPVFAVSDAAVEHAAPTRDTHMLVLDHRDGCRSFYFDLAHLFVLPVQQRGLPPRVSAGDVVGYLCPTAGRSGVLRFAMTSRDEAGRTHTIDPRDAMRSWAVLPFAENRTPPSQPIAA